MSVLGEIDVMPAMLVVLRLLCTGFIMGVGMMLVLARQYGVAAMFLLVLWDDWPDIYRRNRGR